LSLLLLRRPPPPSLFPYAALFRSRGGGSSSMPSGSIQRLSVAKRCSVMWKTRSVAGQVEQDYPGQHGCQAAETQAPVVELGDLQQGTAEQIGACERQQPLQHQQQRERRQQIGHYRSTSPSRTGSSTGSAALPVSVRPVASAPNSGRSWSPATAAACCPTPRSSAGRPPGCGRTRRIPDPA